MITLRPTVTHACRDLAAYLVSVTSVSLTADRQYLLVVDGGPALRQDQVVSAISGVLGTGAVR